MPAPDLDAINAKVQEAARRPPSRRRKDDLMAMLDSTLVSVNTRLPRALRDSVKKESVRRGMRLQDVYAEALIAWLNATLAEDATGD